MGGGLWAVGGGWWAVEGGGVRTEHEDVVRRQEAGVLRERCPLRRARHVVPAAQELGLRPAAQGKGRWGGCQVARSGVDGRVVSRVGSEDRKSGHLQSLAPSRVPLLESRSSIITSAITEG